MGQKIQPKGLRLNINEQFLSTWYSKKSEYSTLVFEDSLIRTYIETSLNKYFLLSDIYISRIKNNEIQILINILYPEEEDLIELLKLFYIKYNTLFNMSINDFINYSKKNVETFVIKVIEYLFIDIKTYIYKTTKKICYLNLNLISNPFLDAFLIAKLMAFQLKKRTPFRKVFRYILENCNNTNILGIKLQIAGRLDGAEIARCEWVQKGKIPLQTLNANIKYATYALPTVYGILGIKVWLYIINK